MSEELKPCPFCGSEDLIVLCDDKIFGYYHVQEGTYVHCNNCKAQGPYVGEDAETAWNNRNGGQR